MFNKTHSNNSIKLTAVVNQLYNLLSNRLIVSCFRISLCDGIVDCDWGEDENLELCLSHYMNGSCSYFPWSDWSKCSQSCGVGKQSRLRGLNSMLFENATCNGPFQEYK